MDYTKYYELESYLFDEVRENFEKNHHLTAEEFFCIIIWKANRAKSKIAQKFDKDSDLNEAIKKLTESIHKAEGEKEKLRVLLEGEYKFLLPTASAILSVLYPNKFSVYDIRVCDMLKEKHHHDEFHKMCNWKFENLWPKYEDYLKAVKKLSGKSNYREADKYLWGKSFYNQLESDVRGRFKKPDKEIKKAPKKSLYN